MTHIPVLLKHLTPEQLKAVVQLDQDCLGGLWTIDGYQRELDSPNSTLLTLSLVTEDKAQEQLIGIGCLWAILEEAHLTLLGIHPQFQGQGLGQLLLYALLRDSIERQLERATLEVRASNQVALNLYQKFGFKVAGRRKNYYEQTGEDALILWLGGLQEAKLHTTLVQQFHHCHQRLISSHWQLIPSDTIQLAF